SKWRSCSCGEVSVLRRHSTLAGQGVPGRRREFHLRARVVRRRRPSTATPPAARSDARHARHRKYLHSILAVLYLRPFRLGRWPARQGNNGIALQRISKGPVPDGRPPQVNKLQSLEEEPPSSASAERQIPLTHPLSYRERNGHVAPRPVPLAG